MDTVGIVNVCLLTADPEADHVIRIKDLFADPIFNLVIVTVVPLVGVHTTSSVSASQTLNAQRIIDALSKSREEDPSRYTIILKDSSVSNSSPSHVANTVKECLNLSSDWDVVYLTRWLDRCDLYKSSVRIGDTSTVITKTSSPNGTQALMFSPLGRDRVLGIKQLKNGSMFLPLDRSIDSALNVAIGEDMMLAYVVVPNLFEFDALLSSNVSDLAKLSDCRAPETEDNKGLLPFIWFVLVVLGVILVIWASRKIGPDDSNVKG